MCQCRMCDDYFSGDKRAIHCADCAYGGPEHLPRPTPVQAEDSDEKQIVQLKQQITELKASNQMAADHMKRDREYVARLEYQLDRIRGLLKDALEIKP